MNVLGLEVPPQVVLGLVTGLTYALLGIGLTLVYRTARILNLAHGEMGATVALLVPWLVYGESMSYWLAVPIAIGAGGLLGAAVERGIIRRLADAPRLLVLVATLGLSQLLFMLQALIPTRGLAGHAFPVPFSATLTVAGVTLPPGHLLILVLVPVVTIALTVFLQRSRIGLASRAVADNEPAAMLAGIPVRSVSLMVWIVAGLLAGVSAVLIGPTRPLVSIVGVGPGLVMRGLLAAVVGGLTSIPLTLLGGVVLGAVEFLVLWNFPTGGWLELVLLVATVALLFWRTDLADEVRRTTGTAWRLGGGIRRLPAAIATSRTARRLRIGTLSAVTLVAILVPLAMSNSHRVLLSSIVLTAAMGCSLVLLTGYAGQVSLGQFAFVALGAIVGGRLNQLGYPPGTALLWATAVGAGAALAIGLPALRIRGLFLSLTTLAFAIFTSTWALNQAWLTRDGAGNSALMIPRPRLFGIDFSGELPYYWLCLAAFALVAAIVAHLPQTALGRAIIAVRDNEPAAATLAVAARRTKLVAFTLAGGLASFIGYFYGGLLVSFSARAQDLFGPQQSLTLIAVVIVGGVSSVTGAVLGAATLQGLLFFVGPSLGSLLGDRFAAFLGGAGLLLIILQYPQGLASALFDVRDRILGRLLGPNAEPAPRVPPAAPLAPAATRDTERAGTAAAPEDAIALEARGVTIRYGGITAVDRVDLVVARGEILGLVGPNGAGKTTLFDALSGQLRPDEGNVLLGGRDVTGHRPERRAVLGMGRTFQQARLFDDLTVSETFKVARERLVPYEAVSSLLGLPPARDDEHRHDEAVADVVDMLGLQQCAHQPVRELSTGTRRLVELGCMIAMEASVMLLDEPTAGLAQREAEQFATVLRSVRDHLDASIVLIDHDIPVVASLVDRLCVMAAGRMIIEGDPDLVRQDPEVIAAYLGTDARAINRSTLSTGVSA